MKTLFHAGVGFAFCACVAGCAGPGASVATDAAATVAAENARDAITIGKSTKADVLAALGKTTAISFDSGFEVWVYQIKDDAPARANLAERILHRGPEKATRGKSEFVVLFAPSGVVTKTRIRPAPAAGEGKGT
jgi:hypothetical protein